MIKLTITECIKMANLRETAAWESGIYQLETTDPVVGGVDGISNKQAIQLANRTGYLKGEIETLKSDASAKLDKDNRFTQNQMVDGYVIANHFHMKMKTQDEFVDGNSEICFRESQPVTTDNPRAFRFMSLNKLKDMINVGVAYQSECDDKYAKLGGYNRFTQNQMVDGYVIANHYHMKMKTQDEFVDGNIDICFRASQPVITDNPTPFRFMSLSKLKEAIKPQLAASFTQNGYVTLDNGLIVQWGKVTGEGEKNFPIAFPRACFTVVAGNADAQGDTGDNAFAYPISKEKFYYATKVTNVYKVIAGYPGSFIAIGW
ncbi:gp53-like domain-containing protein [Campylobacter concisus]